MICPLNLCPSIPSNRSAFPLSQPHGRAWKVLNKRLFVDEVIPKYFRQSKYASFTRQLSGWGFKKLYQTGEGKQLICNK